jgi:lipopolysaccharide export system protein LptC
VKFSVTRLFPLALMFVLALLTFYLDRAVRDEETRPATRRHDPDYLIANFTSTTFNSAGGPETVLSAAKMIHYPDDDSTELVDPRVVQHKAGDARMAVSAARGALSRDGEEIFLYDNVLLVREATAERPEARLSTSFLHVVQDRTLVRTDRDVFMQEGARSLSGRGMEYNYGSGQLELRANVRGKFDPHLDFAPGPQANPRKTP